MARPARPAALAALLCLAAAAPAANPVLPIEGADPTIRRFGDRYYIYPTRPQGDHVAFDVWSSPDLVEWKKEGTALRLADTGWSRGKAWAPDCVERGGKYYFYYSADDSIGVAVGDSPAGPFKDALGKALVPRRPDLSAIDPNVFIDDDGQAYLYWGAVPLSGDRTGREPVLTALSVRPLAEDMVSFAGEERPTVEADNGLNGPHIEGSYVLKRGGKYYLFYSPGSWVAAGGEHAYRVHVATADSPLGPWTKQSGAVLEGDPKTKILATGHNSVLRLPGEDERYVTAYHTHTGDRNRKVYIDELRFGYDGRVLPVRPTQEGVGPVPAKQ